MRDTKDILDFDIYPNPDRAEVSNCISVKTG